MFGTYQLGLTLSCEVQESSLFITFWMYTCWNFFAQPCNVTHPHKLRHVSSHPFNHFPPLLIRMHSTFQCVGVPSIIKVLSPWLRWWNVFWRVQMCHTLTSWWLEIKTVSWDTLLWLKILTQIRLASGVRWWMMKRFSEAEKDVLY